MNLIRYGLIGAAAWLMLPGAAVAEDNQAGLPLNPSDAAGPWTIEDGGAAVCTLTLRATKAGTAGFALSPGGCAGVLPAGAAGWTPTGDGMAITSANGQVLLAFNRWSNSLLVTHIASGADLQLKRGGPGAN
ncbi:MAG TPA: AprI/Inh family metalloprotease inhibitor [Caulobacteraceae bacterium]|nr:AprI/Inh family metalloprotease inhibitor [Caulobacteraceae bacterium]